MTANRTARGRWLGRAFAAMISVALLLGAVLLEKGATSASPQPPEGSSATRVFQAPGAPTSLTATPTGLDNQVRISFTPGPLNGATASEVSYDWSAGGQTGPLPSGGGTVTSGAFVNGRNVSIRVSALTSIDGYIARGEFSAPATVNAYGPPRPPAVSAAGGVNTVRLAWNAARSENGRAIVAVEISTPAGGTRIVRTSGSVNEGSGRSQTHHITARARDTHGIWSAWAGGKIASTWNHPYEQTTHGSACTYVDDCRHVYVELRLWDPGRVVSCKVKLTPWFQDWRRTITVDSTGRARAFTEDDRGRILFDWGRWIQDGRNTVKCRYAK